MTAAGSAPRPWRAAGTARAALVAAAVVVVAGCAVPLPEPQPDPVPVVPPAALSSTQTMSVLAEVNAALDAGDAALDVSRLAPRVTGPALQIRAAEYTVNNALEDDEPLIVLPTTRQASVVPATDTWPRTVLVVTEQPDDLQSPRLLVLRQESARENYTLWGWARLFPGVELPAMPRDQDRGATPLAADAEGLVASPADVVEHYEDVLERGEDSEYLDLFADDLFRERLAAAREQFAGIAEQTGGELTEEYGVDSSQVVAFATAEEGALVVAPLESRLTLTTDERTLSLSAADAALLGAETVEERAVFTWTGVLVFHVPSAVQGGLIEAVAAEHARTGVDGE